MSLHQPKVFKVLHQSHSIAQYHPKKTQDILWPCLRFAISLQAKADQDLNLFESTLLRLLAEGGSDIERLSQQMGLTNELGERSSLAEFLSLKLQQLDLITDRLRLTHEGEQVLNKINSTKTQVIGATVYFDLINSCWLPVISRGEPKPINAEQSLDGFVQFTQGSVGNAKQIKALPLLSEESFQKAPNEREVIDIIRLSRQKNKKLKAYLGNSNGDGFITSSGTISINPNSELVHLHCYAFNVAGINLSYVSDGFRSTTQERFTRGFNSKRNRHYNTSVNAAYERLYEKSRVNHQRRELEESKSLDNLYESLTENKVKNAISQSEYENNLKSFISKSYSEIEHRLSGCYAFSKLNSCIAELATNPQHNADLAVAIASKLEFELDNGKLVNNLLKVNKGSIVYLDAEQPVMAPLLFCHLLAARNDDWQPLAKLARDYPKLFIDIAKLRRWRNSTDHSNTDSIRHEIDSEKVEFINQIVVRVRKTLSAWLQDNNNQVPEQSAPDWLKDDIRSKASHELDNYFGLIRDRMNKPIYQELFDALLLADLKDARGRTNALAGALQHALYQACQSFDANEAKDIEQVKRELAKLGAKQIINSNPYKIQNALDGVNATLGANFIAFWAQITDQQQKEFKDFVKAVDSLDRIRGHSGAILGQHDSLNEIEKMVFKLIKRLME